LKLVLGSIKPNRYQIDLRLNVPATKVIASAITTASKRAAFRSLF
jgi:hypothetical protein